MTRYRIRFTAMLLMLIAVFPILLADICVGTSFIPLTEVLRALFGGCAGIKSVLIVRQLRLPASLMALCVGLDLGICGACMQTLLGNPLASPYTLGISSAAGAGASFAMISGWFSGTFLAGYIPSIFAMTVASVTGVMFCLVARRKHFSQESMVLTGIALMFLFQSIQTFFQYLADTDTMHSIVFWSLGSFEKSNWPRVFTLVAGNLLLLPLIFKEAWALTAMKQGDVQAKTLAIDVEGLRLKCYLYISALTALAVSFVGSIGFIGIAAPHISRIIMGDDQRYYLLAAAFLGAILLLSSSIVSKLVVRGTIFPIGIVTSMIGVPFFAMIVWKRGK